MTYEIHPLADIFPMMAKSELKKLACDIAENGLLEPIWTHEGKIIDGRNRKAACEIAGVVPQYQEYTGAAPLAFVLSKNLSRRHLNESQRAMVAAKVLQSKTGDAVTQEKAAESLNVSRGSVKLANTVTKDGTPELVSAVESGSISVSAASKVAKLPKDEQNAAVEAGQKPPRASGKKDGKPKKDAKPTASPPPPPADDEPIKQPEKYYRDDEPIEQPETLPAPPAGQLETYYRNDGIPDMPGVYRPRLWKNEAGHETVLDAYDNPVPAGVGDTFVEPELRQFLHELTIISEEYDRLEGVFNELKTGRKSHHQYAWADYLTMSDHFKKIRKNVVDAMDLIAAAIPYAVCPECSGQRKGCKSCKTTGYWPRVECEVYPQRFRKAGAK